MSDDFSEAQVAEWQSRVAETRKRLFGDIKYKKHHAEHKKHSERLFAMAKSEKTASIVENHFETPKPLPQRAKAVVRQVLSKLFE